MKIFLFIAVICFAACAPPHEKVAVSDAQSEEKTVSEKNDFNSSPAFGEDVYKEYIPPKLSVFLSEKMPGWKIPAPDKWDKNDFNEFKTANSLVNFVSGDFNCDERIDYALILADERNQAAIWAFFGEKNGFKKIKVEDAGDFSERVGFGLSILEPGEHGGEWNPKPVKIKCQAIEEVIFEKAATAY